MSPSVWQAPAGGAARPTVGDTIWLTRTVALPAGWVVRPVAWDSSGAVQSLGPPTIAVRGDSAVVRWPAVAWTPGRLKIEVPGPVLLSPAGRTDTLAPGQFVVQVASVLPPATPRESLAVQPPAGIVSRTAATPLPVFAAWVVAVAVILPLHLWARRRGRPQTVAPPPAAPFPPVDQWETAGESHAVAAAAAGRLRGELGRLVPGLPPGLGAGELVTRLREERPEWPLDELSDLLHALDEARFTPGPFGGAGELVRWADELAGRLGAAA